MNEITRYDLDQYEGEWATMREDELGDYVLASDYDQLKGENERLGDVLRSIACSLGAGGYNASAVDPDVFEEKICWGIDALTAPLITERDTLRAQLDEARELLKEPEGDTSPEWADEWRNKRDDWLEAHGNE